MTRTGFVEWLGGSAEFGSVVLVRRNNKTTGVVVLDSAHVERLAQLRALVVSRWGLRSEFARPGLSVSLPEGLSRLWVSGFEDERKPAPKMRAALGAAFALSNGARVPKPKRGTVLPAPWARVENGRRGTCGSCYRHPAGYTIEHCGHPTALWPYMLTGPEGAALILAPNGRCWQNLRAAAAEVARRLGGGQ